ncbi:MULTISPECIES: XVIPCD domain-containing protein [unclassified Lysobacter]|uniref:XVIPCD domain-containing protein n=1 Tax=unclassified Lysobacter TaxID=2635362 RepID=UPI001BEC99B5|nr:MULTISPECIES: XVIPCD domain-containing protein [unclassified Lysobacter]MBT2749282.1 hypothetical protein [Lysobacter sp. ISL-42]MBT2753891.1 hypothetical protein [Lysobacter sp. ISL-50]MBT2778949.1 hypothetical protein [Lysobacter sp. ISL-54]MBT2781648.1 hypothetical protein [Lysobacter sp. ISL-52]
MNQPVPAAAQTRVMTDDERRAIAYFAIGVGSEGSIAGRDVSNHLSFAGNTRNGVMTPVGNSGYSIGTLQTDLGQHPEVVPSLVDAYQDWARLQQPERTLTAAQRTQAIADLSRNGNTITTQGGRPMDAGVEANLNEFLRSDAGVTYIHNRDVAQVDELVGGIMPRIAQTAAYRNASADDQVRLTAMVTKVQNQSGDNWTPRLLRDMDNGTLNNVADVSGAIDRLLPRTSGDRDYMETGRDATLQGAEVLIGLRNADSRSPLHQTWQDVVANPLINPSQTGQDAARPQLPAEYGTVKNLFLQKNEAPQLIHALDQGGSYAYGRPRPEGQGRATAGLYASGNDFVVWNRDGSGHSNIGGAWAEVHRNDLTRIRNRDGTTDLDIVRDGQPPQRLLHVDPQAPPLRTTPDPGVPAAAPQAPDASVPNAPATSAPTVPAQGAVPDRAAYEYPLQEQARAAVARLDAQFGRTPDQFSECMSQSLACLARENNFSRIDGVFLSQASGTAMAGQNVFVTQGDPGDPAGLRAYTPTAQAVGTPVQESQQRFADLNEQQAAQQRESQAQQQAQASPVRGGP